MDLPTPEEDFANLSAGSVLRFSNERLSSSEKHFHVIVNDGPYDDGFVMVVATSDVDGRRKARRNMPSQTLVTADPKTCPFLKWESIFDCNSARRYWPNFVFEKYRLGTVLDEKILDDLLDDLKEGVLRSPLIAENIKQLIDPAYSNWDIL